VRLRRHIFVPGNRDLPCRLHQWLRAGERLRQLSLTAMLDLPIIAVHPTNTLHAFNHELSSSDGEGWRRRCASGSTVVGPLKVIVPWPAL